jgi:hypothetical protein
MIHNRSRSAKLILAAFPSAKGFGYAVFEGQSSLIDWGVRGASGAQKNRESLQKMRELLTFYHPDVVVLEDYEGQGSRRARRIEILINLIAAHAHAGGMRTASFSRAEVRASFGLTAKREIAEAIVRAFPELEPRLPPVRKIWMSEDRRMNIFDAVALAITFFNSKSRTKRAA